MQIGFLIISIVKIGALLAYFYGLLWVLGKKEWWIKAIGLIAGFGIIQLALSLKFGGGENPFQIFNSFDQGLLFQACAMTMSPWD